MGRIVVGVDGSEDARHALAWAADEGQLRHAALHVVHAWVPPDFGTEADAELARADAARLLETTAAEVRDRLGDALEVHTHLEHGPAVPHLLDHADGAELLVVGARGRGGFGSLLLGSVSQQLAHNGRCPVVIVHKPD